MRISILSSFSKRVSAHFRIDFSEAKSKCSTSTKSDPDSFRISFPAISALSKLRHKIMTRAPRFAKSLAVAFPIPQLAPAEKTKLFVVIIGPCNQQICHLKRRQSFVRCARGRKIDL
jgi:hypothetical protein